MIKFKRCTRIDIKSFTVRDGDAKNDESKKKKKKKKKVAFTYVGSALCRAIPSANKRLLMGWNNLIVRHTLGNGNRVCFMLTELRR